MRRIGSRCGVMARQAETLLQAETGRASMVPLMRGAQMARTIQSMASPLSQKRAVFERQHFRQQRRTMFIQTETTPNPASLKFIPGQLVLDEKFGTGMYFRQGDREVQRAPLAKRLLRIEGVESVFLGRDFITVSKGGDIIWQNLKPEIFAAVMDHYAEGAPIVTDEPVVSDTTILDTDDEVVAMIKELLESRIRPAVQEDGGDIFYVGFDTERGVVQVRMAGSCSGCPSSSVTLKQGVENMLMHYIPEVKGIEQVEDENLKKVNDDEVKSLEKRLEAAGIPID